jgi:hypothetical protein
MKRLNLIILFLMISCSFTFGNPWEIIKEKTWIAKKDFPTNQYVLFETANGLKKAIFQINGSGRCAVLSLIYDIELIADTIVLKNELNLDNSIAKNGEKVKTFKALFFKNDSILICNDLSLAYGKAFDDAQICNWLETYSGFQIIPIQKLKSISIGENQIYDFHSFNFGPNPENCGTDNNPGLTKIEAAFLNEYLKGPANLKEFDFDDKRIVFATGSNGSTLGSKIDYFEDVREWKENYHAKVATSLIVLNENDRSKYGYDAVIAYWVKVLAPKSTKRILEKTKDKKELQNHQP